MADVTVYLRPGKSPMDTEALDGVAEKFGAEKCLMWIVDEEKATELQMALDATLGGAGAYVIEPT